MTKREALGVFVALTGGLLTVGEGTMLGVGLLAVGAYLFAATKTRPTRENLTAAVASIAG